MTRSGTVVADHPDPDSPLAEAVTHQPEHATTGAERKARAWIFEHDKQPVEIPGDRIDGSIRDEHHFLLVDLEDPTPDDLAWIGRELALPGDALRIASAGWRRPRVSACGDQYLVTATLIRPVDRRRVIAGEWDLIVGKDHLVSIHRLPLTLLDEAIDRATLDPGLLQRDSAFLLYILLDELIGDYEDRSEALQDAIEAMEERALTDASDAFLNDLLALKRAVYTVHRLADQHRTLFAAFLRPDFPFTTRDSVEPYFRDLEERLGWLLDVLSGARDAVNGAFDIYVSRVSHQTNGVMRILTMASTILLPATVLFGFFGTNFVDLPLTTLGGFFVMMILVMISTAVLLWTFWRWGWLSRPERKSSAARNHGDVG